MVLQHTRENRLAGIHQGRTIWEEGLMVSHLQYQIPKEMPLYLLILTSGIALVVSVLSLSSGQTTIFQNLFYFPIIIACIYYLKRGFLFSLLLIGIYGLLIIIFTTGNDVLNGVLIRMALFVLVAGVITYLSHLSLQKTEALAKSEQKYRQLFNASDAGFALHEVMYDESGSPCDYLFIEVNPAFERMTGFYTPDIIGKTHLEVMPRTDTELFEIFKEVTLTGKTVQCDYYMQDLGKHFNITAYVPEEGQFAVLVQEITDRKKQEILLRETNAYLDNLITHANVPIIVWDPGFHITRINAAFERLTGRSAKDLIGKPFSILFSPEQAERSLRLIETTLSGVNWESVEIPIIHQDGTVRNVLWNSSTLFSTDGRAPVATIAQGRDITLEKTLEQEKAKAITKIQENIAQLAILNDGIRNPLTIITTTAEMIEDSTIVDRINNEVTRIDAMVNNLDIEWVNSDKILHYLRKQGHVTSDFNPVLLPAGGLDLSQPAGARDQSHPYKLDLYEEEIQAQVYTILDSIDAFVYVIDMDCYDILYLNEKARERYGNVTGQKCYSHIHKNTDGPCPFCTNNLLINEYGLKKIHRWEFYDTRAEQWLDCRDRAIRWTDGRTVRLEIATDVTFYKLAEETLRRSEEKYRTVFENTGTATVVLEGDGIISLANEGFIALSGYSREEVENTMSWMEFVVPEDLQWMKEQNQLRQECAEKALSHYEFRFVTRTGDLRNIYLSIGVIPETKRSIASLLDITERKRAEDDLHKKTEALHAAYEELCSTEEELRQNLDDLTRNEQALQDSERKYRTVFENTGTATVTLEETGIISLANNEFQLLSGYSREEIENTMSWTEFVVPKDLQWMREQNQLRLEQEEKAFANYEFRFVTRSGEIQDIYLTIGVIPGTKRSIASLLDITERKRAEDELRRKTEALHAAYEEIAATEEELRQNLEEMKRNEDAMQESENLYRSVIENIQDTYYRSDSEGNLVMASPSGLTLLGYDSESEIIGRPVTDLYCNADDRTEFLSLLNTTGSVRDYETWLRKKDGTPVLVSTTSQYYFNTDGEVAGIEGIIRDISSLRSAEPCQAEREENCQLLIDNAHEGILITQDSIIRFVNPRISEMTGISAGDLVGQSISSIVYADDRELVLTRHIKRAAGEQKPANYEFRIIGPETGVVFVHISSTAIRWNGQAATLSLLTDITDQKVAEDGLRQSHQKLRLLTGLTWHDIQNQLVMAVGYQRMALLTDDRDESLEYIKNALNIGENMQTTIGFTREYENLGHEGSGWRRISQVIEAAISEVTPGDITIENRVDPSIEVYADPIIGKVFSTLLDNSIRHGKTVISIHITAFQRNRELILSCEDDGIGIPEYEKQLIFEHRYGNHTGIGLFLAREILSITGLSIHECGVEMKGARFEILVPSGKFRFR